MRVLFRAMFLTEGSGEEFTSSLIQVLAKFSSLWLWYRNEVPVIPLPVNQRLVSAPRGCLDSLAFQVAHPHVLAEFLSC